MSLSNIITAEPAAITTCSVDADGRHCSWTMDTDPDSTNTLKSAVSVTTPS